MAGTFATCWGLVDERMAVYHDTEWAVPCHDDAALFERLLLEGFQAGLSWSTILNRREGFREAFHGWDARRIATYDDAEIARLLGDARIIRNRLKVEGAVKNARAFLALQYEHGSFDRYVWSFAPRDSPVPAERGDVPASSPEAAAMSKALRAAGMTFVGPTICYAFMQSVGMVNDHLSDCPAREKSLRKT